MSKSTLKFKALAFCFIVTLLASTALYIRTVQQVSAAAAWLPGGWTNRLPVTIGNSAATAVSNYQVKITLPATGFDYTKMQPSGADIRLTDNDGVTQLPYWTEQISMTDHSGIIWVKVPTIPANGSDTVYVYYGNATATSTSNGKATFPTMFTNFTDNKAWQGLPNMPASTADETVAQVNGVFYIIGGYNVSANDPLNINIAYTPNLVDPAKSTYTSLPNMPSKRWGPVAVALQSKIYVFGGQGYAPGSTTIADLRANEVYDTIAKTWDTTKSLLPTSSTLGTQGLTGCTDGKTIYLSHGGELWAYNPVNDTYTKKANMPNSVFSWATCSYLNGKIYIMNGYQNTSNPEGAVNYTQVYTIATNTWAQETASPFAMYGSLRESPVIGNYIYLVQGQQVNAEFSSAVYRYDTVSKTWTEGSFGPHAADGVAGGVYNGKIYTFGGRQDWTGPYGLPFAAVYDPTLETDQSWSQMVGNFEADQTGLHRMIPLKGSISNGPGYSQIQSNLITAAGASFVVEEQTNQTVNTGWNSMAVNVNTDGYYNNNLNGYLVPYNDSGLSLKQTSIYKETGTSYINIAHSPLATGTQRFMVINTPSAISLYRNGASLISTTDNAYRGGHVDILASNNNTNTATVKFIFIRQYAAVEPVVTIGNDQTNPNNYAICPCNVWSSGDTSRVVSATTNPAAYELGTRFYSEVAGTITALRFYKVPNMSSNTHTGTLWNSAGTPLATATFSAESTSGWQQATLTTPVAITANTPYVVSYHISGGPFAYTQSDFLSQKYGIAPLHAYQDGTNGLPNGVLSNGDTITYPTLTWSSANYWTDVVFVSQTGL